MLKASLIRSKTYQNFKLQKRASRKQADCFGFFLEIYVLQWRYVVSFISNCLFYFGWIFWYEREDIELFIFAVNYFSLWNLFGYDKNFKL